MEVNESKPFLSHSQDNNQQDIMEEPTGKSLTDSQLEKVKKYVVTFDQAMSISGGLGKPSLYADTHPCCS